MVGEEADQGPATWDRGHGGWPVGPAPDQNGGLIGVELAGERGCRPIRVVGAH